MLYTFSEPNHRPAVIDGWIVVGRVFGTEALGYFDIDASNRIYRLAEPRKIQG